MSTLAALEPGQTLQPGHFLSNELSSELSSGFGEILVLDANRRECGSLLWPGFGPLDSSGTKSPAR